MASLIFIGPQAAFPEYMYGLIAITGQIIAVRCNGRAAG
jgi:hypothetical protein